jgi:hypothetical protein
MGRRTDRLMLLLLAAAAAVGVARGQDPVRAGLESRFAGTVRPFLETYCINCHGQQRPAAQLDLSGFTTMAAFMRDGRRWSQILERARSGGDAAAGCAASAARERRAAVDWFHAVREHETRRNAGDPGVVLARRLSNAEYNYTIRDLTGVDIRPAREFPVDPANTAGFDNSGETLMMSPTLLKKYLAAAREVASHMYLKEEGFAFAPHPMLAETDRDKFAVHQIIDFYHQQNIDYADYFETAWRFRHRRRSGSPTPRWRISRGNTASAPSICRPSGPRWRTRRGRTAREAASDVASLARAAGGSAERGASRL